MRRLAIVAVLLVACTSHSRAAPPDGVLDCDETTEWSLAGYEPGLGFDDPEDALQQFVSIRRLELGGGGRADLGDNRVSLVVDGREVATGQAERFPDGKWFVGDHTECVGVATDS